MPQLHLPGVTYAENSRACPRLFCVNPGAIAGFRSKPVHRAPQRHGAQSISRLQS